jgi:hypothetical protein
MNQNSPRSDPNQHHHNLHTQETSNNNKNLNINPQTNSKSITLLNNSSNSSSSSSNAAAANKTHHRFNNSPLTLSTQQLTIQDAFDPHDSATVHVTKSYWLLDTHPKLNSSANPGNNAKQSFSSFHKLFALNKLDNAAPNPTNGFNFFSNNALKFNMNMGKSASGIGTLSSSRSNTGSVADAQGTKKNSLGKVYRNVNLFDTKYIEYRKKWSEILKREKRNFDNRYLQQNNNVHHTKLEDYELKKTLGSGSFGRVILVKYTRNQHFYALKVLEKKNVIKSKQVEHTINEKKILSSISFPFFVSFFSSFKDNSNLYIVLEFVSGGEMFKHLIKTSRFSENLTRFYCAQVILAIEYLHSLEIVHRDLKPGKLHSIFDLMFT